MSYLQAAHKLWKHDPDPHGDPDHLIAPTLMCLAQSFELGLKAVVISQGKTEDDVRNTYKHDIWQLWEDLRETDLPKMAEQASVWWPSSWPGSQGKTRFEEFEDMLKWLSRVHSGSGDAGKGDYALRYPRSVETKVYPPDLLLDAADTVLGMVEGKISANTLC